MWCLLSLFQLCLKYHHTDNITFWVSKGQSLAQHCERIAPEQLPLLLPYLKPSLSQVSLHHWEEFLQQGGMCFSSLECGLVHYLIVWRSTQLPSHSPGASHSSADSWSQHRSAEQPPGRPAKYWIIKPIFKCLCWQYTPSSSAANTTEVQDHALLKEERTGRFEFYGNEGKYPYSAIQNVNSIS